MSVRDDLTAALRTAIRERDRPVSSALRSALGDIANAEAVPVDPDQSRPPSSQHVAGASAGVGATEAPRREVSEAEQRAIVEHHQRQLLDHAARLTALCRHGDADGARRGAAALRQALTGLGS